MHISNCLEVLKIGLARKEPRYLLFLLNTQMPQEIMNYAARTKASLDFSITALNVAAQKPDASSTGKTCDANKVLQCAKPLTDPVARLTSKVTRDITNIINGG